MLLTPTRHNLNQSVLESFHRFFTLAFGQNHQLRVKQFSR